MSFSFFWELNGDRLVSYPLGISLSFTQNEKSTHETSIFLEKKNSSAISPRNFEDKKYTNTQNIFPKIPFPNYNSVGNKSIILSYQN